MRKYTAPIILALTLLYPQIISAQEVFEETGGLYSTRVLQTNAPLKKGNSVVVRAATTLRGKLVVTTGDVDRPTLYYYKKAKTRSQSRAIDFIDLIAVTLVSTAQGVKLEFRAPNPPPWDESEYGMVEAELMVPDSCFVDMEAVYFDLEATGPFTGLLNTSSLGRLDISDVYGPLDVATANRRVTVDKIRGEISVATSNSSLIATNIECLKGVAGFRNDGGDLSLRDVKGAVNVRNSYGIIEIEGFRPTGSNNYIRCQYGPIIIEVDSMDATQLMVSNRYEDIEITMPPGFSAALNLAVDEGGRIEASGFDFRTELVQSDRLNLVVGGGDGLISGTTRGSGNIYVRGSD